MVGFCNVPEPALERAAQSRCKWTTSFVPTYSIAEKLDEFSDEEYFDLCEDSWAPWEAKTGWRVKYVDQPNANIILTTRPIDGQAGVLAEAQLPCGNIGRRTQLSMWADTGEVWVNAENPSVRMMDARRVFIHEFGHLIGIGHINGVRAIMNPAVSEIRTLLPPDIEQGVLRYGDPASTPGPDGSTPCDQLLRLFITDMKARKTCLNGLELFKRGMANSAASAETANG